MDDEGFLVFTKRGIDRFTKTLPKVGAGEYAVRVELKVPDALFSQPVPTAILTIPASAALAPPVTVDLASMEAVCGVQQGLAWNDPTAPHSTLFRCPSCGFTSWKKDFGSHYKPKPAPPHKKA